VRLCLPLAILSVLIGADTRLLSGKGDIRTPEPKRGLIRRFSQPLLTPVEETRAGKSIEMRKGISPYNLVSW
jgi:hypothetical protein